MGFASTCQVPAGRKERVEKEEDGYADSLPPSSPPPVEDAAADTGAHVAGAAAELAPGNNEGAQSPLLRAPPTVAAAPGAPAAPVPAAAGAAADSVQRSQRSRLSEAAQTLPSHC